MALYDELGRTYGATRRADPRIAAIIEAALADSLTVVNIGAGTGSYEPVQTFASIESQPGRDRSVLASTGASRCRASDPGRGRAHSPQRRLRGRRTRGADHSSLD